MVIAVFLLIVLSLSAVGAAPVALRGDLSIHDPSTIVKCKDRYWLFGTGWGIRSKSSADLISWEAGPRVFTNSPAWTTNAVPRTRGYFWAPDVIQIRGQYLLYYSVSSWGSQTSAIGLATTPTLDPADPAYGWMDRGIVIQSSPKNDHNAIDPSVTLDTAGRLWLAFGSYWSGIKLVQLDPQTGKRLDTNAPAALAWHSSIEAACLQQHEDFYYLFVNWGQCCRGTNSTYNIRIGRSRIPTGPYLDKSGTDLMRDGGTPFLETSGRYIGPGHAAIFSDRGTNWFSFHFYDRDARGASTLGLQRLRWTAEGWPELVE